MNEQALQTPPRDIEAITYEIIFHKESVAKSALDIGRCLSEAKKIVPHGEWGNYLAEKVDFSQRTANDLMRVYKEFSNSHTCANLTFSQMRELLALPAEEREEFVQENDVASMSSRQLQQAIKERDEALEDARRKQEELEAGRQAIEDAKALQEASLQVKNEAEERIREAEERAAESAKEAAEAKAAAKQKQQKAIDTAVKKATKEIEATLAEANEKNADQAKAIQDLEKELSGAKEAIQTAVNDATQETQEAVKAEMAEKDKYIADLERKLYSAGNSAVQKFGVYFEQLQNIYETLISIIETVEDPDQRARLRSAIAEVLKVFAGGLEGGK